MGITKRYIREGNTVLLFLHGKHRSETGLVSQHVIERLLGLVQGELFHHALDVKARRKLDSILRVESVTRGPTVDRDALGDQGNRVDLDVTDSCSYRFHIQLPRQHC